MSNYFNCHYLVHCGEAFHIDKALYHYDARSVSLSQRKFDAEQMHQLTEATEVVGRILRARPGVRDRHDVMAAYERRQFLFLFRVPLHRFYEDWKGRREDTGYLEIFRKNPPVSPVFIFSGMATRQISFMEAGVYSVFRISPSLAFHIMRAKGL